MSVKPEDPIRSFPPDGTWRPLQVRPKIWQGCIKFVDNGVTYVDLDIAAGATYRKGTAMRYSTEVACQIRCDYLNSGGRA